LDSFSGSSCGECLSKAYPLRQIAAQEDEGLYPDQWVSRLKEAKSTQVELLGTTIPTQQKLQADTPIMTNLGYYIKATELKEFKDYIANLPR